MGNPLVYAAILIGAGGGQLRGQGQQLTLHIVVELLTRTVGGSSGAYRAVFVHEGAAAEQVNHVHIGHCPDEAGFGPVYLGRCYITGWQPKSQLSVRRLADKLIAQAELNVNPAVQATNQGIIGTPVHSVPVLDTRVGPGYHGLIGRELLGAPKLSDIVAGTAIDAQQVGVAIGTTQAGEGKVAVHPAQYTFVYAQVGVYLIGRQLILRRLVEVFITRSGQAGQGRTQREGSCPTE